MTIGMDQKFQGPLDQSLLVLLAPKSSSQFALIVCDMFSQGGASGQRKDEESGKINYEICCSPVSIQDHALLLQIKEMLYK